MCKGEAIRFVSHGELPMGSAINCSVIISMCDQIWQNSMGFFQKNHYLCAGQQYDHWSDRAPSLKVITYVLLKCMTAFMCLRWNYWNREITPQTHCYAHYVQSPYIIRIHAHIAHFVKISWLRCGHIRGPVIEYQSAWRPPILLPARKWITNPEVTLTLWGFYTGKFQGREYS